MKRQLTIPNILTIIRILIAMTAPFFLIEGTLWVRIIAGFVCFLAIVTDYIDGWIARKYKQESSLGKILDPIADKALVLICFSVFVYLDVISFWWVIPIFIREIAVTAYRFIFLSKNIVVAAAKSGKIKTVMQMSTLGVAYFMFMINNHFREYVTEFLQYALWAALVVTLYHTIRSGYLFFVNNWPLIKKYHEFT